MIKEYKDYELKPFERSCESTNCYECQDRNCPIEKNAQKKLLEWLSEPCTEHPMTFINTGEKTYSEKRAWCGGCLQSLLRDFGL